jgi:hypothetical protein
MIKFIDRTAEKLALGPERYPEIARLLREHPDLDSVRDRTARHVRPMREL